MQVVTFWVSYKGLFAEAVALLRRNWHGSAPGSAPGLPLWWLNLSDFVKGEWTAASGLLYYCDICRKQQSVIMGHAEAPCHPSWYHSRVLWSHWQGSIRMVCKGTHSTDCQKWIPVLLNNRLYSVLFRFYFISETRIPVLSCKWGHFFATAAKGQ